jgi:hypothetical protein
LLEQTHARERYIREFRMCNDDTGVVSLHMSEPSIVSCPGQQRFLSHAHFRDVSVIGSFLRTVYSVLQNDPKPFELENRQHFANLIDCCSDPDARMSDVIGALITNYPWLIPALTDSYRSDRRACWHVVQYQNDCILFAYCYRSLGSTKPIPTLWEICG